MFAAAAVVVSAGVLSLFQEILPDISWHVFCPIVANCLDPGRCNQQEKNMVCFLSYSRDSLYVVLQASPVVGRVKLNQRTLGDDPGGVVFCLVIEAVLDVFEIHSALDLGQLVELLDVVVQVGVLNEPLHNKIDDCSI